MKEWKVAELVELNIEKTENGQWSAYGEFDLGGFGYNDSLVNGDAEDGTHSGAATPDTIS